MNNRFTSLLAQHRTVILDGAMGTMLFDHGVYINRCFEQLNLTDSKLVQEIHQQYASAGAMVIETNTFGANRFKLASFGLADQLAAINRRGTELAREVAGEQRAVAGSVGPLGTRIAPFGSLSYTEARQAFAEQIDSQVDGGADLVLLETFADLEEIALAIEAAQTIAKRRGIELPIAAMMTVNRLGDTPHGTPPEQFGAHLDRLGADLIGINCSVGPKPMLDTLERLRKVTDRPLAVMPNAGLPTDVDGRTIYMCSPDYMAGYARRFAQIGAQVVGGCCGTTPDHIKAIAVSIRQMSAEERSLEQVTITSEDNGNEEATPVVPLAERSRLAAKLCAGEFVHSIELTPPQGWNLKRILKSAAVVRDAGFDAINIPDGPRASARMGPMGMAAVIEREAGIETIMHYACRDRNLVGMQSDLLGAYAIGLRNVLVITGDPPILGNNPGATPVFDIDAIGLTNLLTRLNNGFDIGNRKIGDPTGFLTLVGLNPTAINLDKELERFHWKIEAGAHGAITQPVFDADQLLGFIERIPASSRVPILAGIWPLMSLRNAEFLANEVPGVSVPPEVIDRMSQAKKDGREREEGERIALEILHRVHREVHGIQVAAPFGKVGGAVRILEEARRLKQ